MSELKTYTATRFLRHNGEKYEAGASIDLNDHFSKPLLALGAIVLKPASEPALLAQETAEETRLRLASEKDAQEKADQAAAAKAADPENLTIPQIKEKLTALNIEFSASANKAELLALLPKA